MYLIIKIIIINKILFFLQNLINKFQNLKKTTKDLTLQILCWGDSKTETVV